MPITPHFTLNQTTSHVELDIRVPHVRVTTESIQVVVLENSILHFASPPYLLVLNFAALADNDLLPLVVEKEEEEEDDEAATATTVTKASSDSMIYRFHESAAEACATYEPTIENGMIRLRLQKAKPVMWNNLDLLGRMVVQNSNNNKTKRKSSSTAATFNQTNKNPTSQWILEEVASTSAAVDDTQENEELHGDGEKNKSSRYSRRKRGYGFAGMFDGVFSDLTRDGLAREMLECPPADEQNNDDDDCLVVDLDDDNDDEDDDCDIKSYSQRRRLQRRRVENEKFDPARYQQDLYDVEEDYIYQCAMAMKPHWIMSSWPSASSSSTTASSDSNSGDMESVTHRLGALAVQDDDNNEIRSSTPSFFTEEERLQLVSIPYPLIPPETSLSLPKQQQQLQHDDNDTASAQVVQESSVDTTTLGILVGLVDLLFAYVYDHLTTDGDATVESAWTVSILSASLSWMEDWRQVIEVPPSTTISDEDMSAIIIASATREVLYSSLRRALIYPYLRNLDFALYCASQVANILHPKDQSKGGGGGGGRRCILRCLLQMRGILNHSELYYLGNKLFIDPYLAWIQQQNSNVLSRKLEFMAKTIREFVVAATTSSVDECKQNLGLLDLIRLETEEIMDDDDNESQASSPSSSSGYESPSDSDDSSSSSEATQLDDDDDDDKSTPSPKAGEPQQQPEKDAVVSTELLDCSLGLSALHIVNPSDDRVSLSQSTSDPTASPIVEESAEQQPDKSAPSATKKLIVALDD